MSDLRSDHPVDLLSAYLDDELSLEDRARVDRHLASCETCRDELDALHLLAAAVAKESVPEVPAELGAKLGRAIDAARVAPLRPRRRWVVPVSIAATLAAVGLLVVFPWRQGTVTPVPGGPERSQAHNETRVRQATPPAEPAAPPSEKVGQTSELPVAAGAPAGAVFAPTPEKKEATNAPQDELGAAKDKGVTGTMKSLGYLAKPSSAPAPSPQATVVEAGAARERRDADRVLAPAPAAARAVAKVAPADCLERWIDAGRVGEWRISDQQVALDELAGVAKSLGGRGVFRPVVDAQYYEIYLSVARYPDLVTALRARGVTGLDAPIAPFEGTDCVRQRVRLTTGETPSAPR